MYPDLAQACSVPSARQISRCRRTTWLTASNGRKFAASSVITHRCQQPAPLSATWMPLPRSHVLRSLVRWSTRVHDRRRQARPLPSPEKYAQAALRRRVSYSQVCLPFMTLLLCRVTIVEFLTLSRLFLPLRLVRCGAVQAKIRGPRSGITLTRQHRSNVKGNTIATWLLVSSAFPLICGRVISNICVGM